MPTMNPSTFPQLLVEAKSRGCEWALALHQPWVRRGAAAGLVSPSLRAERVSSPKAIKRHLVRRWVELTRPTVDLLPSLFPPSLFLPPALTALSLVGAGLDSRYSGSDFALFQFAWTPDSFLKRVALRPLSSLRLTRPSRTWNRRSSPHFRGIARDFVGPFRTRAACLVFFWRTGIYCLHTD